MARRYAVPLRRVSHAGRGSTVVTIASGYSDAGVLGGVRYAASGSPRMPG